MPDYPGATASIEARLTQQWVDGSNNPITLIVFENKQPDPPFPPVDPLTSNAAPFLVCEIAGSSGAPYSFGNTGNRFFVYDGLIVLHVLVPIDSGRSRARQLAFNVGEIFRTALFYVDANGSYIRTIAPNPPDSGGKAEIEGLQLGPSYRVTVTVPFQYFHRA
jgi:hypothetical protein